MLTSPSGWRICPTCNTYIPDGAQHLCPGPGYYGGYVSYTWPLLSDDPETKEILKRIADALEKIAKKVTE
jgi:hypothetical protein